MKFKFLRKCPRGYLVLEKVESKINGQVEVREDFFGKKSLLVGGISQSGHSVEKLWQKPLKIVTSHQSPVTSVLILGLGAGSVAKVIHNFFPKAKMTGVEIDPIMIKLGKKYFNLSTVKNLEIKIADAISLVTNHRSPVTNYDLIFVDLYVGDEVPEKANTDEFIRSVKQLFSPSGTAIFNRLYYGEKKKEAEEFKTKLKKVFSKVEPLRIDVSIFFLCQ
jgi:spermidine synthase